jgi:hypothetical protein
MERLVPVTAYVPSVVGLVSRLGALTRNLACVEVNRITLTSGAFKAEDLVFVQSRETCIFMYFLVQTRTKLLSRQRYCLCICGYEAAVQQRVESLCNDNTAMPEK